MRPVFVNLFIAITLASLGVWLVAPAINSQFGSAVCVPCLTYLRAAGLTQCFSVFSPDVNTSHAELYANVQFKDGKTVVWQFPQTWRMSLLQRMKKERYRALETRILDPQNRIMLADVADYVARDASVRNGGSQPTQVDLMVRWTRLSPPDHSAANEGGLVKFYSRSIGSNS